MQLTLKVELPDNTYTVTTNLYVVVAWERKFKRKASDMANGIGIEDLAYLEFDNFIKQLVNIEVVEQEQPSFTEAAPTDAS